MGIAIIRIRFNDEEFDENRPIDQYIYESLDEVEVDSIEEV